ncbi:MAG TPA: serine hydrolase [Streptosporangiaceae bacterium]|nr:serine hydrolase [Streptosporangiaceae bacterium]
MEADTRMRVVSLIAVTVMAVGVAACSAGGEHQQQAAARAAISAAPRPSATPATPSPSVTPQIQVAGAPSKVKARGAVLADAATGQVLWSRDLNAERPMASVTKVMTALLVLQAGHLGQQIRIPKAAFVYAWKNGGESAALHPGDTLTAQQLLPALLLPSGADAAYTLADVYGPGLNAFVAKMNATAAQMGMTHTHFTSPDGLPYPTETATYSTPSDLLTLGLTAMKYPVFRSIVDLRFYNLPKGRGHHHYWWDNTDGLIGSYQGAMGIKTGYTDVAKHCLLFEASRNGRTLIGAVLGSPTTGVNAGVHDAEKMLNWGFGLPPASASASPS